jgi:hypothetical protein
MGARWFVRFRLASFISAKTWQRGMLVDFRAAPGLQEWTLPLLKSPNVKTL